MMDYNARHIIEALRSGVPSRQVGHCFSSARPQIMADIERCINRVSEERWSGGTIISGKYGEGKTHLLNTVFNMAHDRNMVVSLVSLSKETPFDKLSHIYTKILQATYLPQRLQPGFGHVFDGLGSKSPVAIDMLEYSLKDLEINKLYYVLKSYLGTDDEEEKFRLMADLEGDFLPNAALKQIYKRIYSEKVHFTANFSKTKHMWDYFSFLSQLFLKLGFSGWVILFDEAELIGRLGKKARLRAYENIGKFIHPGKKAALTATYSMFAFNASYIPDVLEGKHEYDNVTDGGYPPERQNEILSVLDAISAAPQLNPLNSEEVAGICQKIQTFHGQAYDWTPNIDNAEILATTEKCGYLLRTRIRATVEILDQLYQYGKVGDIKVHALGETRFDEDIPSLDSLIEEE